MPAHPVRATMAVSVVLRRERAMTHLLKLAASHTHTTIQVPAPWILQYLVARSHRSYYSPASPAVTLSQLTTARIHPAIIETGIRPHPHIRIAK